MLTLDQLFTLENEPDPYISTDLVEKNTWLLSTPLLDIIDNKFSEDMISLYGYNPENDTYVGESINAIVNYGPDPNKVIITPLKSGIMGILFSRK